MNIGPPEFLIILLIVAVLVVTIYGLFRAFNSGDIGWGIGIIVAWIFGLGWILALVYIFAVDRPRSRR